MDEAKKTNLLRTEQFKQQVFVGQVIDIGCGPDPVTPHAVQFDLEHGDAQEILKYFDPETFDCVHSSHCLEHMADVRAALAQWWALVRPGGYLVIVVPHEELYEQGAWPSIFNPDHKATFNLGCVSGPCPARYDIGALVRDLAGAKMIEASIHDKGLDYSLVRHPVNWLGKMLYRLAPRRHFLLSRLMKGGIPLYRINLWIDRLERSLGKPVDQTRGSAVAQIQIVARKMMQSHSHSNEISNFPGASDISSDIGSDR